MLVEDDNNLREIYEARLAAEGYQIVSAQDGEEALALAVKERPDLIIADIMMPKVSGFDMLDILRSTPETKHAKIIMMTALSQAEDKMRAEKLGADRYLVKSQVTLEDVVKVAGDMLSQAAAEPKAETSSTPTTPPSAPVADAPAPTPVPDPTQAATAAPVADDDQATQAPAATPVEPPTVPAPTSIPVTQADDAGTHAPGTTIAPAEPPKTNNDSTPEAEASKQIEDFIANNPTLTTSAEPPKEDTPGAAPDAEAAPVVDKKAEPSSAPEFTEEVIGETPIAPPVPVTPEPPKATSIPVTVKDEEPETAPESPINSDEEASQTLANAVDSLVGPDAEKEDAPALTPTQPPSLEAQPAEESQEPQLAPKRGGERVITPLSDPKESGPDLQALLAKEEANDSITPPAINTVIQPGGATTVAGSEPVATSPADASAGEVVTPPPDDQETPKTENPTNIAL